MGGTGIRHFTHLARRAACALAVVTASLAGASTASAALTPGTSCQTLPAGTCLAAPFAPGAQSAGVLANLGSPTSPEEDLTQALSDLSGAADAGAAAKARGRAPAIPRGSATPLVADEKAYLDDKAYKGIALLGTQAKVQDVPAGTTTVDVREVRFGDHALLAPSITPRVSTRRCCASPTWARPSRSAGTSPSLARASAASSRPPPSRRAARPRTRSCSRSGPRLR